MNSYLQLPLQVQAVLVSGYLGYFFINRNHNKLKLMDIWLTILILGLPTALIVQSFVSKWAYASVLIGPVLGALWSWGGRSNLHRLLRWSDVSYETGEGDAWKTLTARKNARVTQITVTVKDGSKYLCDNAHAFVHNTFAPYVKDEDGIAFYVTHYCKKINGEYGDWIATNVSDDVWGDEITYFPRANIELLEIRCKTV